MTAVRRVASIVVGAALILGPVSATADTHDSRFAAEEAPKAPFVFQPKDDPDLRGTVLGVEDPATAAVDTPNLDYALETGAVFFRPSTATITAGFTLKAGADKFYENLKIEWDYVVSARNPGTPQSTEIGDGPVGAYTLAEFPDISRSQGVARVSYIYQTRTQREVKSYYLLIAPPTNTTFKRVKADDVVKQELVMAAPGFAMTFVPNPLAKVTGLLFSGWSFFGDVSEALTPARENCPSMQVDQIYSLTSTWSLVDDRAVLNLKTLVFRDAADVERWSAFPDGTVQPLCNNTTELTYR